MEFYPIAYYWEKFLDVLYSNMWAECINSMLFCTFEKLKNVFRVSCKGVRIKMNPWFTFKKGNIFANKQLFPISHFLSLFWVRADIWLQV